MGVVKTITATRFPKQGKYLGEEVLVCFHYDTSKTVHGVVVRDDQEEPGRMIIRLDGDRYVDSTECQWQPRRTRDSEPAG